MKKPPPLKTNAQATMVNGKLSIKLPEESDKHKKMILEYVIEKCGGYVFFELSPPKRPRKTGKGSQSAHFNGHCVTISMETKQPFQSVKDYLKSQAITRGYPMLVDIDGAPILDVWGNVQGISEADCEVDQCNFLIEEAHQFADEMGIKLIEGE
jgi:hypothetical protein